MAVHVLQNLLACIIPISRWYITKWYRFAYHLTSLYGSSVIWQSDVNVQSEASWMGQPMTPWEHTQSYEI